MQNDATTDAAHPGAAGATPAEASASPPPRRIGRYRVVKPVGEGGFGCVYLAEDEQLLRRVAVKVPHRRRVAGPEDAAAYLAEARAAALLDHPNVVPVYDVGTADDCPCFIVSKYVEGCSLSDRLRDHRLTPAESADLTATLAEALHDAHRKGLVHRDVKPGNVLIDPGGKPYLTDFGLALKEQDAGRGAGYGGTPAYMSPEQARGEGHRVDGRSDVFSLGVVFYEMLTHRRPFNGDTREELLAQIGSLDPRPPRQYDDNVPRELERITLKALSKRASDRYATAGDMAEDLRHWLAGAGGAVGATARVAPAAVAPLDAATAGKAIFLSHATPDAPAARELCKLLEQQGIGCWIAPRDVAPGDDYGESVIRGIEAAATTVLLLSSHANASIHVRNEIERATSKRRRVVPVRLEDVAPNKSMELHLSTAQWMDAWKIGMDQVALKLAEIARGPASRGVTPPSAGSPAPAPSSSSDNRPRRIVPKGLRSFDAGDADFFLELLPGPRDRDGLPDSIRFWKSRVEESDADNTFAVGLIYGPSGCGKSSLVKAGLLPRLAGRVTAVYVEATAEDTEARLLAGLRKRCPALPAGPGLKETLAALRRGQGAPAGTKVLIVLDQFEQWLHAKKEQTNTELVQALRQCDGGHLQCMVMVRDDFWLAVSRFLRELEVRLVEGHNSALVDLFDADHARKVLTAYGRAFGKLPEKASELTEAQSQFLRQAVAGLSQEGKVISVRLALFAEMMRGKHWTPAALKEVGGAEGVGVTFLEETFSAAGAPPEHRVHQKAARSVLKALLPESGTDIKGHMRSHAELLEASGYAARPAEFDALIRILDGEVRLLTPTDPEGQAGADEAAPTATQLLPGQRYYQLTHDYLVPSMRQWLTRKQKETRRGRAELTLADRAGIWNARPENRQLPSLRQWSNIRFFTNRKTWTPPQRKMMARAGRFHLLRGSALALLLLVATFAGLVVRRQVVEQRNATQADGLVQSLLNADVAQIPAVIDALPPYRRWADGLLRDTLRQAEADNDSRRRLRASLALLPADPGRQADYLCGRLLDAEPGEVKVLRDALAPYKDSLRDRLWAAARAPRQGHESQPLRAAAALAAYDPGGEPWAEAGAAVADDLVGQNPVFLGLWSELLRPVKGRLIPRLGERFRDPQPEHAAERSLATNLLADYATGEPRVLADLLMDADEKQFAVLFPRLGGQAAGGLAVLIAEMDWALPPDAKDEEKERLAKRQAAAAVALLRLNQPERVWPLLKHSPDPRARSYLIHRFVPLGADAGPLIKRLDEETDLSIRRALILSLGEFGSRQIPADQRDALTTKFQALYRTDADPGLHAAVEWLLRTWSQQAWLQEANEQWGKDVQQRQKLKGIAAALAGDHPKASPRWYVNRQGQTMVVLPGPAEFVMGSPTGEKDHNEEETQHAVRINRTFALAAKAVTVEQYRQFDDAYNLPPTYTRMPDLPVVATSWYQAAAYCNWLSRQEHVPEDQWCYETGTDGQVNRLKADYLSLGGYRLPTEAEVEYATRAGAVTSRSYGETDELLSRYAWYFGNSGEKNWPVGSKKPNDLGFFDLHGNEFCWCQEAFHPYPDPKDGSVIEDTEDDLEVVATRSRVLRGGSFLDLASNVRLAFRNYNVPADRNFIVIGFRAARTLRPDSLTPLPPPAEGGQNLK